MAANGLVGRRSLLWRSIVLLLTLVVFVAQGLSVADGSVVSETRVAFVEEKAERRELASKRPKWLSKRCSKAATKCMSKTVAAPEISSYSQMCDSQTTYFTDVLSCMKKKKCKNKALKTFCQKGLDLDLLKSFCSVSLCANY